VRTGAARAPRAQRRPRARRRAAEVTPAAGSNTAVHPTLPALVIARSPANDVRVILEAMSAMPALRVLAGERDGWLGEHRAELRALLQHLTTRLSGTIEGAASRIAASPERPAADAPRTSSTVSPAAAPHHDGDDRSPRTARPTARPTARSTAHPTERPSTRHRQGRESPRDLPPAAAPASEWDGGSLLR